VFRRTSRRFLFGHAMTTTVARKTCVIHRGWLSGRFNPMLEMMQRSSKERKHQYDHACGHTDNSLDMSSPTQHRPGTHFRNKRGNP
jgi:hypothetical protein